MSTEPEVVRTLVGALVAVPVDLAFIAQTLAEQDDVVKQLSGTQADFTASEMLRMVQSQAGISVTYTQVYQILQSFGWLGSDGATLFLNQVAQAAALQIRTQMSATQTRCIEDQIRLDPEFSRDVSNRCSPYGLDAVGLFLADKARRPQLL